MESNTEDRMPFIEDVLNRKITPRAGLSLEPLEYTLKSFGSQTQVVQSKAGTVFIGAYAECRQYVQQQRSKQAVRAAEKTLGLKGNKVDTCKQFISSLGYGQHPDFTR